MHRQATFARTGRILASGLVFALLVGSIPAGAQRNRVTLEPGTVIPVVIENQLASNKSRKGDFFTAKVKMDDKSYLGLPQGTRIEGVIKEARPKRDKEPGVLDLDFRTIRMPDGKTYPITSNLIGLDNKSVETQEDGRLVAKEGHKRNDLKYVGYGAAAGALFSLLGNKGRISIENLLLGSAAGYAAGALIKGPKEARDVVLKPGTEIGVRLDKAVRFERQETNDVPEDDRAPLTPEDDARTTDGFAVLMGDRTVVFPQKAQPFRSGETWMLPVKAIFDTAGIRYRYNSSSKSLEVLDSSHGLKVGVGSQVAVMSDGARRRLDKPVREVNGSLFASVRFFELATQMRANYDQSSNTLVFNER